MEVSINADIKALCLDLSVQKVHTFTRKRKIHNPSPKSRTAKQKTRAVTAVRDVLLDGMEMLTEKVCMSIGYRGLGQVGQICMVLILRLEWVRWRVLMLNQHLRIQMGEWRLILHWILILQWNVPLPTSRSGIDWRRDYFKHTVHVNNFESATEQDLMKNLEQRSREKGQCSHCFQSDHTWAAY